jgi:hypothetical protein
MAELKTHITSQDPVAYLKTVVPEQKQFDGLTLLKLFENVTGEKATMWGSSIVGFGKYHYKSEKSKQEGDWMLVGFAPRKQNLTLYIMHGNEDSQELLSKLGKHTTSAGSMGGCLYINKISDVNLDILSQLINKSYQYMKKKVV